MMPNGDLKKFLRDSRPLHLNRQAVRAPPTERVSRFLLFESYSINTNACMLDGHWYRAFKLAGWAEITNWTKSKTNFHWYGGFYEPLVFVNFLACPKAIKSSLNQFWLRSQYHYTSLNCLCRKMNPASKNLQSIQSIDNSKSNIKVFEE